MHSILALSFLALAGFSAAQDQPQNNYPYTIDPESVPGFERQTWCDNQKAQCPLICLQQPDVTTMSTIENDCDPDALTYSCVCDNNVAPNITQFSQTLPYYICTEWGNQCQKGCGNDNTCLDSCRADHPCGAQHPNPPNSTALSTMSQTAAPTGASTSVPVTGFGEATGTPGNGGAQSTLNLGAGYSLAIVLASAFAGFAILL